MKRSIPEFIKTLSDNDYEILEEIFVDKYRKFMEAYWLIRDYSDYITTLKYKKTKKDILKISMTLTKLKADDVLMELNERLGDNDHILIWNEKKVIHIEIQKDESELP